MDDLALAAASALMTAMATDAWGEARAGAVSLWRRVYPERASAIESELADVRNELVAAQEAGDGEARSELTADWRRKFRRIEQAHPELIPALLLLEGEWTRLVPTAVHSRSETTNVKQTATATYGGTAYQAGRNLYQFGRNQDSADS